MNSKWKKKSPSIYRVRNIEMLSEAGKKKKGTKKKEDQKTPTTAYGATSPEFNFAPPLGPANLYKGQGIANWGPYTTSVESMSAYGLDNETLEGMGEAKINEASAWDPFKRIVEGKGSSWEAAQRLINMMK